MEYQSAEMQSLTVLQNSPFASRYFSGLVNINAFTDRGDSSALSRAEASWTSILAEAENQKSPNPLVPLYRGMTSLQLSYIASIRGQTLRTGRLAWAARSNLRRASDFVEAAAALALFDYYREKLLEKIRFLPFVNPNPNASFQRLREAAGESRYLRDVFRASAFWIHYDRNEFDSALAITGEFLQRYPENRLVRQMRGDVLFRSGHFTDAQNVYEPLLHEYKSLKDSCKTCLPIGFACATGNLARIYAGLGMKTKSVAFLAEWKKMEAGTLGPWLPGSLKRELSHLAP